MRITALKPQACPLAQYNLIHRAQLNSIMIIITPTSSTLMIHHHVHKPTSTQTAPPPPAAALQRRSLLSGVAVLGSVQMSSPPWASGDDLIQRWGTHSFLKERFFQPGLSPEDAAARIRQTAEGLHSIRDMLEHMSWRYVMFYIRLKQNYLSQDLKNAMSTLPQSRRQEYVNTANELVDNMAEFDYYVRTPKVYESYLYYEKTLKSIDNIVALLG